VKFKVLSDLKFGGTLYQKGEEIELTDTDETNSLVTDGIVEAIPEAEVPVEPESEDSGEPGPVKPKRGRPRK